MDRDEDSAFEQYSLVFLSLVLRYADPNQNARESAQSAAYANSSKSRNDRTRCNNGADSRNCERAHSNQPSQGSSYCRTGSGTESCALRRFCGLVASLVLGPRLFWH